MDKLAAAIEKAGGQAGYDILVHCNFERTTKEIFEFLNGGLADGLLLFAPTADDPLLPLLRKSALPVVILNGRDAKLQLPSVADDRSRGMEIVAEQLLDHGHLRIGAVSASGPEVRESDVRISLLRQNLQNKGVTMRDEDIFEIDPDPRDTVRRILRKADAPTAVFCWHDRLAYRILSACEQLSVSVPDQLSVIGYDGLQWPSGTRHIASSVLVDFQALATEAITILDSYIGGYNGPVIDTLLPVSFVNGTSLGSISDMQRSN